MRQETISEREEAPTVPARDEVRRALVPFLGFAARRGLVDFAIDYACYFAALAGILFLPSLWLKIPLGIFAGVKISNLGTLGHDAAHNNLTRSPRLNRVLGFFCFLPGLFNYQLWIYDHHYVHHPFNNGRHRDSWTPFTKAAFDAMPRWRQVLERFYRMPAGIGLAPYYIIERWWAVKFFPRGFLPRRFRPAAWRYFALMVVYLAAFLALLAAGPLYAPTTAPSALLCGFVLPFYVWQTLFSFTVYVQHTHPDIPWFDGPIDRRNTVPMEQISLHLSFPMWFSVFAHHVYEHAAHHVNPRIPYPRLRAAQARLNAISPHYAVSARFSLSWLYDTMRRCKLYDYEAHRWLDFAGRPTAPCPLDAAQIAAVARGAGTMFVEPV